MIGSALGAALVLVVLLIHGLGGTDSALTYMVLLPVLGGAFFFGLPGAMALAIPATLLIGPYMPEYALTAYQHPEQEWLIRGAGVILVGLLAGFWQRRVRGEVARREQAGRIDPTTALPNGVAWVEKLESALAAQSTSAPTIAAAVLRATDLTEITDVTGVESGDRILRYLALRLQRTCPEVTLTCRFSGSELALVVEAPDVPALKRIARDLHDAASASFEVDGAPVRIEPAIGLGHAGTEPGNALELVRRARVALRRARAQEKDWVSHEPAFDESDKHETIRLIARAEMAIKDGEFELHYQPKVRLVDGQPAGVEALARWRRGDGEFVPPGAFMPKLENTSLIDTFSRFVIAAATDCARTGSLGPVSINLAPRNLSDESLINTLIAGLQKTNTPPEHFEVEITEGALMREPEHAIALLQKLRDQGIGVSIDDFGTGYSSFAYLRRLPATNLKIDREFVRPLEGDARARRLVMAMIESGHALGMTVTAEGVETAEQARIVADLGCDLGQGFLWSPGKPEPDLREWVESARNQATRASGTGPLHAISS
ncbi:MAG: bifunctional diguanylate cyclase/phosphodiesterase [Halofilum sp. (in: g-proteobacteria)]|nr:bifunctional diguanylate cyclase/phosphodiesterase [Halofilum sp. (in: g-proteobacteria)]